MDAGQQGGRCYTAEGEGGARGSFWKRDIPKVLGKKQAGLELARGLLWNGVSVSGGNESVSSTARAIEKTVEKAGGGSVGMVGW